MKKFLVIVVILCLMLSISACQTDSNKFYDFLNGIVQNAGNTQITEQHDLIGNRVLDKDAYTGRYNAYCEGNTGRDVIFGGGSIESKKLHVYGIIHTNTGKATVRIRLNEDIKELSVKEDGSFETHLSLNSGGNYIMMDYEDFNGEIELRSEYEID